MGLKLLPKKGISLCALQSLCVIKANQLMIFKEIIYDFSVVHKKQKKSRD